MERLTNTGNVHADANRSYYEVYDRLKAYEDTGLTPDEIKKMNDFEHSELATALAKLEKATREREALSERLPRWIPVTERLPEEPGRYLTISEINWAHGGSMDDNGGDVRRNMIIAYFDAAGKFNMPRIAYWMPLPKSPGKEEEG